MLMFIPVWSNLLKPSSEICEMFESLTSSWRYISGNFRPFILFLNLILVMREAAHMITFLFVCHILLKVADKIGRRGSGVTSSRISIQISFMSSEAHNKTLQCQAPVTPTFFCASEVFIIWANSFFRLVAPVFLLGFVKTLCISLSISIGRLDILQRFRECVFDIGCIAITSSNLIPKWPKKVLARLRKAIDKLIKLFFSPLFAYEFASVRTSLCGQFIAVKRFGYL